MNYKKTFLFIFFVGFASNYLPLFSGIEQQYEQGTLVDLYKDQQFWQVAKVNEVYQNRSANIRRIEYTFQKPMFFGLLKKEATWSDNGRAIQDDHKIRAIKRTEATRPTALGYGALLLSTIGAATLAYYKWFKN